MVPFSFASSARNLRTLDDVMVSFAVDATLESRTVFINMRQRLAVLTRSFRVIGHDSKAVWARTVQMVSYCFLYGCSMGQGNLPIPVCVDLASNRTLTVLAFTRRCFTERRLISHYYGCSEMWFPVNPAPEIGSCQLHLHIVCHMPHVTFSWRHHYMIETTPKATITVSPVDMPS